MKIHYFILLSLGLFITACGGKKSNVQQKREELEKIKKEIANLQNQAKKLENEIEALEPKKDNSKLVETEVVIPGSFETYLNIEGKADAEQSTIATAQLPGTVTQVLVKPGDPVSAGQALAYLDNSTLRQSRGQIEQQLTFANTLFEKQKRLWQQGVGTEIQFLSAKNQKEALEKNLATLDAQLSMYTVKAPISGTVESIDTKIGQAAAPGIPMFKVVNLSNLKVVADVAESYSSKINKGDKVKVVFTDINKTIESTVAFASKVIDPLNRSFKIEIRLNGANDVKPNMLAKLKIADYRNDKAITVPTNAITAGVDEKYVMVKTMKNGKAIAVKRIVKPGQTGESRTEILDGIQAGDEIIVTGFQELNDGQIIEAAGK
ncbi:MAG: efflux RND transporter periplasmic adaptor subunit [Bacteroidetes bacterium]|jgi:membrane fusion protein, multidrug efflux system|nr:efflux RND transporter periplasmic adaptor subunit [Bacteroidota bacterium]